MEVVNEQNDVDSTVNTTRDPLDTDLETTVELDNTADTIETNGNFVNDSIVQATNNNSTLTTLKRHLREKYLNDIDVIQRSTARDPEAWTKLDEITEQIETLNKLLRDTDDLILQPDQENGQNQQPFNEKPQIAAEICCPICFEEMTPPKQILCCTNGHPVCSDCDGKVKICPVCRETFGKASRRNPFAERLISVFLQATTSQHD